jgi:choline dehydrogenase-like flavoprotein
MLGSTVDRHGARRARVVNQLSESDVDSFRRTRQLVVASLVEAGAEPIASTDEVDPFALWYGSAHHMCSTRMHVDPTLGVVDADGRVHGTANLYCAGSSVFSTGGYANPTLTALALTTKLADHLGNGST